MSILPVRLGDLIHARTVESVRLDFKATWDRFVLDGAIRTICAFANDFQGLNGGYIVLGIGEIDGRPVLPPAGLDGFDLERLQKEIRGACNRIEPGYQPILAPEIFMERPIVVIYAPMGDSRPYQAPETCAGPSSKHYYIRLGAETVKADRDAGLRTQLLQLTARLPVDERRRADVPLTALSPRLIQKYLDDVGTRLADADHPLDGPDVLRRLRLTGGLNGAEAPRTAAVLFFTERPDEYIRNAAIELAQFRDGAGGDLLETRTFQGPIHQQARDVFTYLESLFGSFIAKSPGDLRARRFLPYPDEAVREIIINAIFHRSYDVDGLATRIGLYPDRLEVTSYPGPVPGVEHVHLTEGVPPPQVPARNPRVGELLKALRLAETWRTGIPRVHRTMRDNGSPAPRFEFDSARTYFRVTLPAHPGYVALHALREAAALWHTGERVRSIGQVRTALDKVPQSGVLAAQLIEYLASMDDLAAARLVLADLEQTSGAFDRHLAYLALARAYLDAGDESEAAALLENVPTDEDASSQSLVDLAILHKRAKKDQEAHSIFSSIAMSIQDDPKALHEFAQTKIRLARAIRGGTPAAREVPRRLYREAAQLLTRVVRLAADQPTRSARAWFDLAQARRALGDAEPAVVEAIDRAIQLAPTERKFTEWRAKHIGSKP